MSDLRPCAVKKEIGGRERNLLFTINVIDEIQSSCNMPLIDAIIKVAEAADGNIEHETIVTYREVFKALVNGNNEERVTEEEAGTLLTLGNYREVARTILKVYGISDLDPDSRDDDEMEEENPNQQTGQ